MTRPQTDKNMYNTKLNTWCIQKTQKNQKHTQNELTPVQ